MTWYADLSPCDYFGAEYSVFFRAIGWLEREHDFTTGAVDRRVFERLGELQRDAWQPGLFIGLHQCDLCLYDGVYGQRNLFVPGDGCVYVCPELITHTMNAHGYCPPDEFCRAVLSCPAMGTTAYFKAMLAAGARELMRPGGSANG